VVALLSRLPNFILNWHPHNSFSQGRAKYLGRTSTTTSRAIAARQPIVLLTYLQFQTEVCILMSVCFEAWFPYDHYPVQ